MSHYPNIAGVTPIAPAAMAILIKIFRIFISKMDKESLPNDASGKLILAGGFKDGLIFMLNVGFTMKRRTMHLFCVCM
ncbi:MAG TPA: hypothetical protein VIF82_11970 [Burkholderiaceae bacterium]|jgi:hypothetical protein